MRLRIEFLLYLGMLGMPLLLVLTVIARAADNGIVPPLEAVLALVAIAFGVAGLIEVFLHGRKR